MMLDEEHLEWWPAQCKDLVMLTLIIIQLVDEPVLSHESHFLLKTDYTRAQFLNLDTTAISGCGGPSCVL